VPKQLSAPTTRPGHRRLQALAEDLSEEVEVGPLLDRILTHSTRLLDGAAGSISLVDEDAGYYRKAADLGVACSSGQVFPLDEGVTGQVVAERRPVVLDRYAAVTGGHLPSGDPVAEGGVVAVPIWWRDAIIGADVVFAGRRRQFTTAEVDRLETVAQVAAVAITNARRQAEAEAEARRSTAADERDAATRGLATVLLELRAAEEDLAWERVPASEQAGVRQGLDRARDAVEEGLAELRRRAGPRGAMAERSLVEALRQESGWATRTGRIQVRVSVAGDERELPVQSSQAVLRIAREALTNAAVHAAPSLFRLGLVYGHAGLTLLALDDGRGFDLASGGRADVATGSGLRRMAEEARSVRGTFSAESVPGWGTVIRAHVPYGERPAPPDRATGPAAPLTPREREVLGLLVQGLTDQQIADALAISVRTAEKHVGGVLHKLDARNRTEAVGRALERGWARR
jgi:DNA-binding CsgD family transcriptional regulator/nitrate/nitrite-specific signal transduction histidine kinase